MVTNKVCLPMTVAIVTLVTNICNALPVDAGELPEPQGQHSLLHRIAQPIVLQDLSKIAFEANTSDIMEEAIFTKDYDSYYRFIAISLGDICFSSAMGLSQDGSVGFLVAEKPTKIKQGTYWRHSYTVIRSPNITHFAMLKHMVVRFRGIQVSMKRVSLHGGPSNESSSFWQASGISRGVTLGEISLTILGKTKQSYPLCMEDSKTEEVSLTAVNWSGVEQKIDANVSWTTLNNGRTRSRELDVTIWTFGNNNTEMDLEVRYNYLSCFPGNDEAGEVKMYTVHTPAMKEIYKRQTWHCPRDKKLQSHLEIEARRKPLRLVRVSVGIGLSLDKTGSPSLSRDAAFRSTGKHRSRRNVELSSKSPTPVNQPTTTINRTSHKAVVNATLKVPVPSSSTSGATGGRSIVVAVVGCICMALLILAGTFFTLHNAKSVNEEKKLKTKSGEKSMSSKVKLTSDQRERRERQRTLQLLLEDSMSAINTNTYDDDGYERDQLNAREVSTAYRSESNKKHSSQKRNSLDTYAKKDKHRKKSLKKNRLLSTTTSDISFKTIINQSEYVSVYLFPGTSNTSRLAEREKELGIYEFQRDRSRTRSVHHVARKRVKSRRSLKYPNIDTLLKTLPSRTKVPVTRSTETRQDGSRGGVTEDRQSRNKTPKGSPLNTKEATTMASKGEQKIKKRSKRKEKASKVAATTANTLLVTGDATSQPPSNSNLSNTGSVGKSESRNNNENNNVAGCNADTKPAKSSHVWEASNHHLKVHTYSMRSPEKYEDRDSFSEVAVYYQ